MTLMNGAIIDKAINFTPVTRKCRCGVEIARFTSIDESDRNEFPRYCTPCQIMEDRLVRPRASINGPLMLEVCRG